MRRRTYLISFLILFYFTITFSNVLKENKKSNLQKQSNTQSPLIIDRKKLDVNNISAWFRNDGEFYSDHATGGPGFEWPKSSGITAIYSAGLWIGAKVQTEFTKEIRVATVGHLASEYRPGRILPDGTPEDFTQPHLRQGADG